MSWEKAKLGDIIKIQKGKAITKKDSKEGPYPVILGGREPAYYIDQYNHTGKAIVVSRSGASAGYISFWNEAIFVTDGFLVEPKFFCILAIKLYTCPFLHDTAILWHSDSLTAILSTHSKCGLLRYNNFWHQ